MRTLYLSLCCTAMLATVPAFGLETLPQLQLANSYQQQDAVADFWISEKLDGVRAFWDGHQLRSRSGQWIKLPEPLRKQLPAFALDAELWAGRGAVSTGDAGFTAQFNRRSLADDSPDGI